MSLDTILRDGRVFDSLLLHHVVSMFRTLLFAVSFLFAVAILNSSVNGQANPYFWSFENLNEGATNASPSRTFSVGETASVFLYYSAREGGPSIGAFWDVDTAQEGIIDFLGAETLEFAINEGPETVGYRWTENGNNGPGAGGVFGPGTVGADGQSFHFNAFTVTGGDGILETNSGPVFVDQGYDSGADAFLFGRVDFVAREVGNTQFDVTPGSSDGCTDCFGGITITVVPEPGGTFALTILAIFLSGKRRRNRGNN